ncbi:hypothetical protein IKF28_01110 [Candidatus Saccharibacteria bacterium]|nr:hypothetical protein [Candidatus Saccharibacteria bacterium]
MTSNTKDVFRIAGWVYDSPKYPDGAPIVTSAIVKMEKGIATTRSGHEYELGNKNEAVKAMEEGIPVIEEAQIQVRELMVDPPKDLQSPDFAEQILEAKTKQGLVLWGKSIEGDNMIGEVLNQEGNYYTLKVSKGKSIKDLFEFKEQKVYVCSVFDY